MNTLSPSQWEFEVSFLGPCFNLYIHEVSSYSLMYAAEFAYHQL